MATIATSAETQYQRWYTSYEIMELFQKLNDNGKTIVFVTHEEDIARFMKRNIVFRDGLIKKELTVEDRHSATELIAQLPAEVDVEL